MKILLVTPLYPPDIGGPASYSKKLVEELPRHGIAVEVAYFGLVRHLPKGIRHVLFLFHIIKKAKGCDILFAQDPVSVGFPAAVSALLLQKKLVVKIVGDYAWEQATQRFDVEETLEEFLPRRYEWRVERLRVLERFVARRALCVIVPSHYLKTVVERWNVPSEKITVVYNDITIPLVPSRTSARARLSIKEHALVLMSAGRLVPWKGFEMLIDLMSQVVERHPAATLYIAGDGPLHRFLLERVYAKGLERNIVLLGSLDRSALCAYIRASDIFLLNTAYEGFSHQLLEAFAIGTPTITTSAGGNKEIVRDGVNALMAPYNQKELWEEAFRRLIADAALRQKLSDQAKNDAIRFLGNNMIDVLEKLFRKL